MSGIVVKHGSISFKIYNTPTKKPRRRGKPRGKYKAWTIVYHKGNQRFREKISKLAVAKRRADQIKIDLANGETEATQLTSADRVEFACVRQINAPTGNSLIITISDAAAAKKELPPGTTLLRAAQFYVEHHRDNVKPLNVPELVDKFIQTKRDQNLSGVHLDDLQTRCNRFAKAFSCPLTAVTRSDLVDWLHGLKDARTGERLGPRSRNNYRAAVLNLVEFAKDLRNAPKDWDELTNVPAAECPREEIEIWTPSEMRLLLEGAGNALTAKKLNFDMVPYLAIGGFAGPRQAELGRLDWRKNVKLDNNQINLGADITKTDKGRKTPIADNLAAWLKPYQGCHGPVCRYQNISNALVKLGKYLGIEWKHNALRHSFITYRVALTNDVGKVALEAGNSVQQIHDSYLEFSITADEARQWFAILPADTGQKVLALKFGDSP